ncbi:MAG: ATP-binding protein [bacterium]
MAKILYIEDEKIHRDLIRNILCEHEIIDASDGFEGIEKARQEKPDLILIDINLPGINGYETTTRIRNMEGIRAIPIVAVTADSADENREISLAAGCDGFISKLSRLEEYRRKVQWYLEGKKDALEDSDKLNYLKKYQDRLVTHLEEKIAELEREKNNLKTTQSQLLQQEKMASIGQLAAGVAHEINNPIGYINSNLCTLKKYLAKICLYKKHCQEVWSGLKDIDHPKIKDAFLDLENCSTELKLPFIFEDIESLVDESLEGTERVRKIVADLKSFSHLDEAELKDADLNQGLQSTINIVWNELKYKANLIKELGEIPLVRCYPQQINQVFMNLLVNAAQAIESQGEIRVKTSLEEGQVLVEISDTGCGIPQENLSRIFEPFFTTKEIGKGTGLGLSMAYDIIRKHRGEIQVTSQIGKGTTFRLLIPLDGVDVQHKNTLIPGGEDRIGKEL